MDCSLVISNYMCILRFYMFIARIFVISSPDYFFIGSWEWTIYCYIRHGNHYCDILGNKMKKDKKKYHTVGTFPKSNRKITEREKSIPLTHIYMTTHFPVH